MSIIIYGGAFNPPHKGHESVVRLLSESYPKARIFIMPTKTPPHKTIAPGSPSPEERLGLCQTAFGQIPGVEISDYEIRQDTISYSFLTVSGLKKIYPHQRFYLVIGSDQLLSFRTWHRYRGILQLCTLLVVSREIDDLPQLEAMAESLRQKEHGRVHILKKDPLVISSERLRQVLSGQSEDTSLIRLIHPDVLKEIQEKKYYKQK